MLTTELLAVLSLAEGASANLLGLGLAVGLGIAAFGGALGQGRAVAGATEAVSRQPEAGGRIQTMMIIGVALIETLVIYMLVFCLIMMGKVEKPAEHKAASQVTVVERA